MHGVPGFEILDSVERTPSRSFEPADFERIDEEDALQIADEWFGVAASAVTRLDTERDDSFRLVTRRGDRVLKIAHPADGWESINLQLAAISHARHADRHLPLQHVVRARSGNSWISLPNGRVAWMFEWLDGGLLRDATTGPTELVQLGSALGRLSKALSDFTDESTVHTFAWDLQTVPRLNSLLAHFPDDSVATAIDRYNTRVVPRLDALPTQVIHNDFNPGNVLVDPGASDYVVGILDFGDIVYSLRIADLAVALCYQLSPMRHNWMSLTPMIDAFADRVALTDDELAVLPDLVAARFAQRILINQWLHRDTSNHSDSQETTLAALTAFLDLETS